MNKNIFGQYLIIKKAIIRTIGVLTHKTFNNKRFNIHGTSILNKIPTSFYNDESWILKSLIHKELDEKENQKLALNQIINL